MSRRDLHGDAWTEEQKTALDKAGNSAMHYVEEEMRKMWRNQQSS